MKPLEFGEALFVRRMTDGFLDVEFVDAHPFGNEGPGTVVMDEPLHDNSAARLIEAVENLARRIIHVADNKRLKVRCTRLKITASQLKLTVFEFKETE